MFRRGTYRTYQDVSKMHFKNAEKLSSVLTQTVSLECTHRELSFGLLGAQSINNERTSLKSRQKLSNLK